MQLPHHQNHAYQSKAGKQNAVQVGRKSHAKTVQPIIYIYVRYYVYRSQQYWHINKSSGKTTMAQQLDKYQTSLHNSHAVNQ